MARPSETPAPVVSPTQPRVATETGARTPPPSSGTPIREIVFRVRRYQPQGEKGPYYQDYAVPYRDDEVVLDGLNYIKDNIDPTLTFRWSCRMGICGSCGMDVNGKPKLTCGTFIRDASQSGVVQVDPLTSFNSIKDLVTDFDPFMEHFLHVKPWIIREKPKPLSEGEFVQYPEDLLAFRQQSLCINCTLCMAACPVFQGDNRFIGPASLALALRYIRDTRDQGAEDRFQRISTEHGIWECTFVGECSVVCPKEVDPAGAIQTLKLMATTRRMKKLLMPKAASR